MVNEGAFERRHVGVRCPVGLPLWRDSAQNVAVGIRSEWRGGVDDRGGAWSALEADAMVTAAVASGW